MKKIKIDVWGVVFVVVVAALAWRGFSSCRAKPDEEAAAPAAAPEAAAPRPSGLPSSRAGLEPSRPQPSYVYQPSAAPAAPAASAAPADKCARQFDASQDIPRLLDRIARGKAKVDIPQVYGAIGRYAQCEAMAERSEDPCAFLAGLKGWNTATVNEQACARVLSTVSPWQDINAGKLPQNKKFCGLITAPGTDPGRACARLVKLWGDRAPDLCAQMGSSLKPTIARECPARFERIQAPVFVPGAKSRSEERLEEMIMHSYWHRAQPNCDQLELKSPNVLFPYLAQGACHGALHPGSCGALLAPVVSLFCAAD